MPVLQPKLHQYLKRHPSGWLQALPTLGNRGTGELEELEIQVRDVTALNYQFLSLPKQALAPTDTVMRGHYFVRELQPGLELRCGNSREELSFQSHGQHQPGLSCIFFLQGHVDVGVGEHRLAFRSGPNGLVHAAGIYKQQAAPFLRTTRGPQNVLHLVVSASPDWLMQNGFYDLLQQSLAQRGSKDGINFIQWLGDEGLTQLLLDIFNPPVMQEALLNLHLHAKGLDIIRETVSRLLNNDLNSNGRSKTSDSGLNRYDKLKLNRAKELIHAEHAQPLNIENIAKAAGTSSSGLQRLFRRAEGISVFGYVRQAKLNQAYKGIKEKRLSIKEASSFAGYASPANFATAFKKHFGFKPSELSSKKRLLP